MTQREFSQSLPLEPTQGVLTEEESGEGGGDAVSHEGTILPPDALHRGENGNFDLSQSNPDFPSASSQLNPSASSQLNSVIPSASSQPNPSASSQPNPDIPSASSQPNPNIPSASSQQQSELHALHTRSRKVEKRRRGEVAQPVTDTSSQQQQPVPIALPRKVKKNAKRRRGETQPGPDIPSTSQHQPDTPSLPIQDKAAVKRSRGVVKPGPDIASTSQQQSDQPLLPARKEKKRRPRKARMVGEDGGGARRQPKNNEPKIRRRAKRVTIATQRKLKKEEVEAAEKWALENPKWTCQHCLVRINVGIERWDHCVYKGCSADKKAKEVQCPCCFKKLGTVSAINFHLHAPPNSCPLSSLDDFIRCPLERKDPNDPNKKEYCKFKTMNKTEFDLHPHNFTAKPQNPCELCGEIKSKTPEALAKHQENCTDPRLAIKLHNLREIGKSLEAVSESRLAAKIAFYNLCSDLIEFEYEAVPTAQDARRKHRKATYGHGFYIDEKKKRD